MKNKLNWLEAVLVVAPFLVVFALWNQLPAQVPIHWNLAGQVDRWSSKGFGMLFLPLISLGVVALCRMLPRFDPKLRVRSEQTGRMRAALRIFRLSFAAFFCVIFSVQLAATFGHSFPTGRTVISSILLMLAITGNYFGNLRPNYFFGIRTPWTLESPATWRATHRLGGRLMFFGSLALLLLGFVISERLFVFLVVAGTLSFAAWGVLYSWYHFRTSAKTDQRVSISSP